MMYSPAFFHLSQGVRAGGGIGDVIEPPDGADNEYVRILFDFSFFLFITLILLAIIQGFIIDAFGALRDQLQGVEDELAGNCFICGISKDYLDQIPHGFETHVKKEHNLANYLFFLMYLINKDESITLARKRMSGTCIRKDAGTSSLKVTASANNMRVSWEAVEANYQNFV